MKGKLTNKDVETILRNAAKKIGKELDDEKILAKCFMDIAKKDLLATFTDKQNELYEKYVTAKQKYIDVLTEREKATKK